MNKILKPLATACVALLLASCGGTLPYQDPSLSPDERATDLIGRLTLKEKVSLMQFASPAIPRLDIKEYNWWNEALHGVGRSGLATVFPQCVGMAASWDDALVQDVFTAVSDEARAKSNEYAKSGGLKIYQGLTFWTPNVNIFRDPRWGRGQETYGEDPYLTARMGVNVVRGLQGPEGSKYDKLHACAKHFAVHSGPEWNRHIFNAENIAPRDLWETYLPAFKVLVQEANVKEVMCAYNRYEGEPCCGSNRLLQQILRDEWGFQGLVVSDCWAISDFYTPGRHHTEPDSAHASAKAVASGTDLECGESYRSLVKAVGEGLISESRLDTALHRVLKARFELGEFDKDVPWHQIPLSVVDSKKHRELALRMAQESIVLLQNRNNILPLKKEDLKILIVEGTDRVLRTMSEDASRHAYEYLGHLMVDVKLNTTMVGYDNNVVKFADGEEVYCETLIWTAGITGEPIDGFDKSVYARGGRFKVDEYNRVDGYDNIFALGDISYLEAPEYPRGYPQLAQVAIQQARCLAENLNSGKFDKKFKYNDKGSMATVGRNRAVADLHKLHMYGRPAWVTWMFVHLISILGMRNKLTVLINWIWAYIFYTTSLRLLIRPVKYPIRKHWVDD